MIIYIIGRMRGIEFFNYNAFCKNEDELVKLGWSAINPHSEDWRNGFDVFHYAKTSPNWNEYPPGMNVQELYKRCEECVQRADAIFVLRGGLGEGGLREYRKAVELGKLVFFEQDGYPNVPTSASCEIRITNKDTGGQKGEKPEQCDQIPPAALLELARHYGKGASKYEAHNFRKGYKWSLTYNACMRHLLQFWGGEDIDKETGSKHVIAAAWHCLTMATFMDEHKEKDDRYKGGAK